MLGAQCCAAQVPKLPGASGSAQEPPYLACQRSGAGLLGVEIDDPTVDVRIKLPFCQKHTDITMSNAASFILKIRK